MEVFEAVRTVLAVRTYQDKPVPPDIIRRILEAGRLTGSSMNRQPWHFIVVEDGGTLRQLGALASTGPYVAQAPLAIVVAQGYKTYFLQDGDGQMKQTHSISAGLDYVGVSPILARMHEQGRARFEYATDDETVAALKLTMEKEGIIPALESSHAFARAFKEAPLLSCDQILIINQSGRGDKDIFTVADAIGDPKWKDFIRAKAGEYNER